MSFVRGPNPIWFMSNLTGAPLNDTYYAFFLTNDLPYVPQAVYQDPNGTIPWSDPIEFQPSSGLPNNLYFDPSLYYRIEIRNGPLQTDPLIYLIENYIAGQNTSGENLLGEADNMITNPNFSDIFFTSPHTITTAGTYDISPGWQLILTGIGTTVLTQVANPGSPGTIVGNPPYYLTINNAGWTTAKLVQRFSNNGAIFGSGAIAVSFSAFATGANQLLSIIYSPSNNTNDQTIFGGQIVTGAFNQYAGAVNLNASTNTDTGQDAFVDIEFVLPVNGILSLTNIQIVGQSVPLPNNFIFPSNTPNPISSVPGYSEETYERIVDQEFHVYKDSLVNQAKEDIAVGWNFGLNPWQFRTTAVTNVANNTYTADQTIVIQQKYVQSGGAGMNNIAVGRGTDGENFGFRVDAVTSTNQFAILQYIDPASIRPYWGKILSSMIKARIVTSHSTTIRFKMRLIYRTTLPPTVSQLEPVASWTSGGDPVFAAGWTAIVPENDPVYTLSSASVNRFPFNGFVLPSATSSDMTLGIMVYTINDMNATALSEDSIVFDSVSLVNNDFAIDSPPKTFDQVLRECEFYYEKSHDIGIVPAVGGSQRGAYLFPQNADTDITGTRMFGGSINLPYKVIKRDDPSAATKINFYSPGTGAINTVDAYIVGGGSILASANVTFDTNYILVEALASGNQGVTYFCTNTTALVSSATPNSLNPFGFIRFHYTVDSRLGAP